MFQHLTLGGQNEGGKSAVNELSHLCLEATSKVGLTQPSLSIRWFYGCPDDFLIHAIETASYGTGMPAFFNDEVLIPNMLQQGYCLEEARGYGIVGCTEATVPCITEPWLTGGFTNIIKVLERTIFNGYDPVKNEQRPFKTGYPESFSTFADFMQAYFEQLSYYLKQQVVLDNILDKLHATTVPTPFESVFTRDCLERGKTNLEGGARYNSTTFQAVGIANVADSLATIKKFIYEDKTLTWPVLKEALLKNYEGFEELRLSIQHQVPKYGNDDSYVDSLGEEVLDHLYRELKKYKNPRGGNYYIALYTIACNVLLADKVGSTPDGRKKGMVLADGGVSCSQGSDKEGPTALLTSVTKLDPYKALGSTLLNLKFNPNIFNDSTNYHKIAALVKTFFMMKGQHVQFNVVDVETLRDAQKHPEKYPCLVVRVAGFSVLFTTIDPKCQEDIILRTAHDSHG
jgi:formate C-acetyltransferase